MSQIYASIERMEAQSGKKVDLLICCGDFQAVRNKGDLQAMNVPSKYLTMVRVDMMSRTGTPRRDLG